MKSDTGQLETALLAAVSLVLTAVLVIYYRADAQLNQTYSVALEPVAVPGDAEAIAEGERLAWVRGCFWCHGAQLEGQQYFADALRGVIVVAPNLTQKIRDNTAGEFARALRHGVAADGTSLQPAMPSFAFYNMSDADLGAIMAYIGSLPEQRGLAGEFRLLPLGWWRWVRGELPPNVADLIDHDADRPDPAVIGNTVDRGRYLAESICTECHGDNGRIRVPNSPDLQIALSYSRAEFHRLMRTGAPRIDKPIDYHMVDAAKYRYTYMTDAEIDALYDYFQSFLQLADSR